jgi:fatty acid amide hydrolase 2
VERFDAARREADVADARIASGGDELPLLGVPCTIKESFAVKGMPNCAGLLARRDHRAETTAPSVQRLIDAGAIPLGLTNISELTLWCESDNRVYGRSSTPYDSSSAAGGSSGGEGAAVGSGASPFGLGSDIAGSIRIPAFFCGVFGHKPSNGLVPHTGSYPVPHGEAKRLLGFGPLARRAEDLMPVLRILSGPDGVGPLVTGEPQLGDPASVSLDARASPRQDVPARRSHGVTRMRARSRRRSVTVSFCTRRSQESPRGTGTPMVASTYSSRWPSSTSRPSLSRRCPSVSAPAGFRSVCRLRRRRGAITSRSPSRWSSSASLAAGLRRKPRRQRGL